MHDHTPTQAELWAAQLTFWPNSVRLSGSDVQDWVFCKTIPMEQQMRRAYNVALALSKPNAVWYRVGPEPDAPMGYRYGLNGAEYMSGFTFL